MFGLGTIINASAVVAGGILGMIFKNNIKESMQKSLMHVCGVSTILIGVGGTMSKMLSVTDTGIETVGTMLLILSLVIGTIAGELLRVEDRMDTLGERIKRLAKRENDSQFVDGFVNVSLVICIGAMAIVGSIEDGMSGNFSMLEAKAVLDGIIVMVFATTYGVGAVFSALPLFVYQGAITVVARFCGSFASEALISNLSYVGSALIFCVGINVTFGKKIKVGNMLPAMLVPIVYDIVVRMI